MASSQNFICWCSISFGSKEELDGHFRSEHGQELDNTSYIKEEYPDESQEEQFEDNSIETQMVKLEPVEVSPPPRNSLNIIEGRSSQKDTANIEEISDVKVKKDEFTVCTICTNLLYTKKGGNSRHSCAACKQYKEVKALLLSVGAAVDCNICIWKAPTILDLNDHMINEHEQVLPRFTCMCGKTWSKEGKSQMVTHAYACHLQAKKTCRKWTCLSCDVNKETLESFVDHWKDMELPCWLNIQDKASGKTKEITICHKCGATVQKEGIVSHYFRDHSELVYCMERARSKTLYYYCCVCGTKSATVEALTHHFADSCWNWDEDCPKKRSFGFGCEVCSATFGEFKELEEHRKEKCIKIKETDSLPETTSFSSNAISFNKFNLKTSLDRFHCDKCSMFIRTSFQGAHRSAICQRYKRVKRHLQEANVVSKCGFCGWEGLTVLNLGDHMIWQHEKKLLKYACNCGKEFNDQSGFLKHVANIHLGRKNTC